MVVSDSRFQHFFHVWIVKVCFEKPKTSNCDCCIINTNIKTSITSKFHNQFASPQPNFFVIAVSAQFLKARLFRIRPLFSLLLINIFPVVRGQKCLLQISGFIGIE